MHPQARELAGIRGLLDPLGSSLENLLEKIRAVRVNDLNLIPLGTTNEPIKQQEPGQTLATAFADLTCVQTVHHVSTIWSTWLY